MSYRSERNEDHFSAAEKIAWDFVLPYRYVPILDSDTHTANKLAKFLSDRFSKQALNLATTPKESSNDQ